MLTFQAGGVLISTNRIMDRRKIYKYNGRRIAEGLYQIWESLQIIFIYRTDEVHDVWEVFVLSDGPTKSLYVGGSKAECLDYINENHEELRIEYIGRERRNRYRRALYRDKKNVQNIF